MPSACSVPWRCAGTAVSAGSTRVGYGTGWVQGGAIPGTHPAARGEVLHQRSGPGRPCKGLEWWVQGLGRTGRRDGSQDHPPGPVGPPVALPVLGPSECRPWPIRARLRSIFRKLSQNGEVSSKSTQKACHSPYFQNEVQISPLDFLRFPIWPAFSHKELMGRF